MEGNREGPWSPKVAEVGLLMVTEAGSGRPRRGSECGWVSQSCSVWGCRRVAKVTKSFALAWGLRGSLRDVLEQCWRHVFPHSRCAYYVGFLTERWWRSCLQQRSKLCYDRPPNCAPQQAAACRISKNKQEQKKQTARTPC